MHSGNFVLILHTHLPWVLHHGTWPHGEHWLFEATAECYIPLLNTFDELVNDKILPKITIGISPVLCEQLEHPDFKELFVKYCDEKILAAQVDEKQFRDWGYDPHHIYLTKYWQQWYEDRKNDFINKYNSSIIGGFKKLFDIGAIEIMTCGATHGYLPLLGTDNSVNLQLKLAVENFKKHFGRQPRGTWLPECAYRPAYDWKTLIPINPFHVSHYRHGVEHFLAKNGLEYFVTDQNLLERSVKLGSYIDIDKAQMLPFTAKNNFDITPSNIYNVCSNTNTQYGSAVVFTRNHKLSMQVWSGEIGYPGEPNYLDFHKKQYKSLLRYWRVTNSKLDMMYKKLYHPEWTQEKVYLQTKHFRSQIESVAISYFNKNNQLATVCSPYDTELFGHWWFEGPQFLNSLLREINASGFLRSSNASEQIYNIKPKDIIALPEGSWGENNNHDVWSNPATIWTWEAIYNNELRFSNLMTNYGVSSIHGSARRILTQALRELLLMQSSDWQFLITTKSAVDYAEQRFSYHHSDFNKLCDLFEKNYEMNTLLSTEDQYLTDVETRNSCFEELELEWWYD